MKVLVLNGSPKENSNTMILTTAFLAGLQEKHEHDVKIVTVRSQNIQPFKDVCPAGFVGMGSV